MSLLRPPLPAPDIPGSLSLLALWRQGSAAERAGVLGGWLATLVACLGLGLLSVQQGWSGVALSMGGLPLYLTFYPPLTLCLWWALALGWRWGALPAYLSTLVLALQAGMPASWALLFACANPLGLAVMSLGYQAVGHSPGLSQWRDWMFYVPLAFIAAVFSSTGSLIWSFSQQLPARDQLAVWQGWWLGAFLQSLVLAAPLMMLSWPRLAGWRKRRPALFHAPPRGRRTLGLGLLLAIVLGVLGYGLVSLGLGSMQLRVALEGGQWAPLADAAHTMLSTAWVFFWVFTLIVFFVAQFGYQALSRWLRGTEALVMQLAQLNAELEQRSRTDGLTGLANRMAAEEGLRAQLRARRRYGTPAAVLMLDIDHFKRVNDQYGHAAGDAVIRALAQTLKDASRDVDLPGRYGGEEFVIGLSHTDLAGARHFAERLRARIAGTPVEWSGQHLSYTVSIGVAAMGDADSSIDDVLRRADAALYRAKEGGRNRVMVDEPAAPAAP